jgi:DNA-binding SARP family transcriptional activator/tetratricopeptide (TPR) repeat protein
MSDQDSPALRFEVLGPLRAWRGKSELVLGALQQRAVLAVLLLNANKRLPREQLINAIWGARFPAFAVNLVQKHVSGLRRTLEPERSPRTPSRLLSWTETGYCLAVPAGRLDLQMFETDIERSRAARAIGDLMRADDALHTALALWHGPVCDGLTGPLVEAERERLGQWRIDVVEDRIELDLELGAHLELVNELRALVAQHPWRERLRVLLMLALYRSGRQAEALAAFHDARRHLIDELGVEPGPQLRRVHEQILAADPSLIDIRAAGRTEVQWASRPASLVPAQLPYGMPDFAGRDGELERLDALFAANGAGRAVVITAIGGMAGVGKTALAVHWAHRVRERFPDGQLYVNLRGFDPTGFAVEPAEAIRGFLDAFAVPPQRIPISLEGQAALFRSMIADQRMLVILDNAVNAEQVRPLLPGAPGCMVLVTSRDQLSGLVAAEGALPLTVNLLSGAEAQQLLARRLGEARVRSDPGAVAEIIEQCAHLPLALAIVAARAATHPDFPLAALARELREARGSLDAFHTEDRSTDIRSVFSWSIKRLSRTAQRVFRLLGLHPGQDISLLAAASLGGVRPVDARAALAELAGANLVIEHMAGRYTLHDLLRAYATELVQTLESEAERRAAMQRGCDHYLQTAFPADRLINPLRDPPEVAPARPGVTPAPISAPDEAMQWFTTEHSVLLAVIEQAVSHQLGACGWQLAWAVWTYLDRRAGWEDLAAIQQTALSAAEQVGDRTGQAFSHQGIARAYSRLARYDSAHQHLHAALGLFERLGDRPGQANSHLNLAAVLELQGRDPEALDHAQQGLDLYRAADHAAGLADALNAVGWYNARVGNHRQGLICCQEALTLYETLGDLGGRAQTWDSLGFVNHHLGHEKEALVCYENALELFKELGDRYNEAATLVRLGDTHSAAGADDAARHAWQQALDIFTEIGHPEALQARARLNRRQPQSRLLRTRNSIAH